MPLTAILSSDHISQATGDGGIEKKNLKIIAKMRVTVVTIA